MPRHRWIVIFIAALACSATARAQDAPDARSAADRPLMRDFMGINGHTVQFDAPLYAPLCRLVRDYHTMGWDTGDATSNETTFPLSRNKIGWKDRSGRFRDFQGRVDWKDLYSGWQEAGFEIDASIMLPAANEWEDMERDAYRYGKAFAQYFGPSGEHPLVTSAEVGNEPAGRDRYSPQQYQRVFRAMARGLRDGDPKLTILTATAAVEDGDYEMPLALFKDAGDLYDVINVHSYATIKGWPTWERSYPEDDGIQYLKVIQDAIDWRDRHAPDKQVWITEFGYDSSTQQPTEKPFERWVDVTDAQQAQWIVRSFLCFAAMDLDRAYLYWFNDGDQPKLHASSGVTRHYQPKPSYFAMRHLYQTLGEYRLGRVVEQQTGNRYIYEFVRGDDPDDLIWVIWSPTGEDREADAAITLPGTLVKAERMPLSDAPSVAIDVKQDTTGRVHLTVTESPAFVWIER